MIACRLAWPKTCCVVLCRQILQIHIDVLHHVLVRDFLLFRGNQGTGRIGGRQEPAHSPYRQPDQKHRKQYPPAPPNCDGDILFPAARNSRSSGLPVIVSLSVNMLSFPMGQELCRSTGSSFSFNSPGSRPAKTWRENHPGSMVRVCSLCLSLGLSAVRSVAAQN